MIPRGQLDIGWLLLASAALPIRRPAAARVAVEAWFDRSNAAVACLSVRSALDAVLHTSGWPPGSEILLTAVTIPAMPAIIREHGYLPVPVDVSPTTLAPDPRQVAERVTPRTRAILVAHLFGSRLDLHEIAELARARRLELWEDLAQGFLGEPDRERNAREQDSSDVRFYSFGVIKRRTALGGGVVVFRDPGRGQLCRDLMDGWPRQSPRAFRRRVYRALMWKLLEQRGGFTVAAGLAHLCRRDLDAWLSQALRGFRGDNWLAQIRQRPSGAQLRLLRRRLAPAPADDAWKSELARLYRQQLPADQQVGAEAGIQSPWTFPIRASEPAALRTALWRRGYDATVSGSHLAVVAAPAEYRHWTTPAASRWLPQLIYLPLHPALSRRDVDAICQLAREAPPAPVET